MSLLERIIAYKREEVAARKARISRAALEGASDELPLSRGFLTALLNCTDRPALIAEVKKASPSSGVVRADFNPVEIARAYHLGGATCLSVLTDAPSFQGSEAYLTAIAEISPLPILRKDFIIDPWQVGESRAIGADAILIIMAAVDDGLARDIYDAAVDGGMDALIEVHDEAELERALLLGAGMIGVNNRSLATFETDLATTERLAPRVPKGRLLVSESGINTPADIARLQRAGAGAFLVGEALMRAPDVSEATRSLLKA